MFDGALTTAVAEPGTFWSTVRQHATKSATKARRCMQVCPPPDCQEFGCPGHEFAVKGIRGCGIDTAAAAVGTEMALEFLVADSGVPARVATVTRTIRVVRRCPTGINYCAEDNTCSLVRCCR